ncbi:MAG: sulfotransferase [Bacteroidota bacterium]|nr:sulfotransferase [Bacteroidota bacterium]
MKLFVVIGLQRTGTTLLASMLGRHPEINMLFESVTKDSLKLIGKKWNGNKLLAYRQIRQKQRATKFGYLINRFANFDFKAKNRHHLIRPFPTSIMSVEDYKKLGAIFITIERDKKSSVSSMKRRAGQSEKQASYEWEQGMKIINRLKDEGSYSLTFVDLVNNPEKILKEICDFLDVDFLKDRMLEGPKYNFVYPQDTIVKKEA